MSQSLNLVFCGTPLFAVPTLEKLVAAGHRIRLVVTQPDRPKGRGLELIASPVKQSAQKLNLPIAQPDRIKTNNEFRAQLTALNPDAIIVVGYGRIIPQWMLDLPPLGNINLHASLLPKYRGAAPIQWAIANGETVTGVTTMRIDAGLDTGDILLQKELPLGHDDTSETVAPLLASIGADLIVHTLRGLQAGTVQPHPQDNSKAALSNPEKGRRPHRFLSLGVRHLQPHPRFPTLARSLHKIPRQESSDPKSAARHDRNFTRRSQRHRRSSPSRLRPKQFPGTARNPAGRKEAKLRARFHPRLPPPAGRKVGFKLI